jgi:hypothetical protein
MNRASFRAGVITTYLRLSATPIGISTNDLLERGTGIVQSFRVVPGASLSILPPRAPNLARNYLISGVATQVWVKHSSSPFDKQRDYRTSRNS